MGRTIQRTSVRVPLEMSLNTYAAEAQERCVSVNLATRGLYLLREQQAEPLPDTGRVLQLEFELPGTSEVIWARGEVASNRVAPDVRGCRGFGVRFAAMADRHWGLVRDYVIERRITHYQRLLARIAARGEAERNGRSGRSAGAWTRRWRSPAPLRRRELLSPRGRDTGDSLDDLQGLVARFRDPRPTFHHAGR